MKNFVVQFIIATAVVFCAANDCELNDYLLEINTSNSTVVPFNNTKSGSYHFNASDENYPEDFECYDDLVEDVNNRDGLFELSCTSSPITIVPTRLKNYKKQIRDVVNIPNYEQKITYIKCSEKNVMCEHGQNSPKGFAYVCRQKYVKMTLKVFDSESGGMIEELFPIPSYCACEYVKLKTRN